MTTRDSRGGHSHRGFALIELLVVIGILAILLAILVPTLREARLSAIETAALARQRDVGLTLTSHCGARRGVLPFLGEPRKWIGMYTLRRQTHHFTLYNQSQLWADAVHEQGIAEVLGAMLAPEIGHESVVFEDYTIRYAYDRLAWAAFVGPGFWNDGPQLEAEVGPQSLSAVAHPSKKGLLIRENHARLAASERFSNAQRLLVWFPDGHGAILDRWGMREPVQVRRHPAVAEPVLTTRDGLLGRDR